MANFNAKNLKKIGVYTSGGDAPGMNAAIRAVVRTAIYHKLDVVGFNNGYLGMLNSNSLDLDLRSVANIIQKGGTFLKSGRCLEFKEANTRKKAAENIKTLGVDALVCIGGDGSFQGAHLLWEEHQIPVIGVPGTIDNDIFGSDNSIGFDTAVNTALEAIDRIRDTAASHDRLFIVEVMGRNSGFIATSVGLAGGAEDIFIPEIPYDMKTILNHIKQSIERGKKSSILITAEGHKPGRAYDLAESLRKQGNFDAKVCILGHIQRGGAPTAIDRILASRLGHQAVLELLNGQSDLMVGTEANKLITAPLESSAHSKKSVDKELIDLIQVLAL